MRPGIFPRAVSRSPGTIPTPLAHDEITGADLLMDGGVIAALHAGRIQVRVG